LCLAWPVAVHSPPHPIGGCSRLPQGLPISAIMDPWGMCQRACMNICTLFWGLVHTPNGNTFPLPWQLVAPQKSGQILDIQYNISSVYMYR
jgi:hypothetical protein